VKGAFKLNEGGLPLEHSVDLLVRHDGNAVAAAPARRLAPAALRRRWKNAAGQRQASKARL